MEPIEDFYGDVTEAPVERSVESTTRGLEAADNEWREALSAEWVQIYERLMAQVDGLFASAGIQRKDVHLSIYGTQLVTGAEVVFTDFAPEGDQAADQTAAPSYWPDETKACHGQCADCDCGAADTKAYHDGIAYMGDVTADQAIDPNAFFASGSAEKILKELATCGYCGQPISPFEVGPEPSTSTIIGEYKPLPKSDIKFPGDPYISRARPYDNIAAADAEIDAAIDPKEFFKPKAMTALLDALQQHKDIEVGVSNEQIRKDYAKQVLDQLLFAAKHNPAMQLVDLNSVANHMADQYTQYKRATIEVDDEFTHTEQHSTREDIRSATKADIDELYHKEVPANLFSKGDRVKMGDYFRGYVNQITGPFGRTGFGTHQYTYNVQVQDTDQVMFNVPENLLTLWPFEAPLK